MEIVILFLLFGGGAFLAIVFAVLAFTSKSPGAAIALRALAVICLLMQIGCWSRAREFGGHF